MTPREVSRRVLRRVEAEDGFPGPILAAEASAAGLDDRDRGLASELVYGVLRHRTRLDHALQGAATRRLRVSGALRTVLRVAAYQLLFLDRVPAHAAVDDAVGAARAVGGARMAGLVNALLRRLAREGAAPIEEADRLARVEVTCSLPRWIASHLERRVGAAELEAAAAALAAPAPLYLRVNTLRAGRDQVIARLAADHPGGHFAPAPADPDALVADGLGDPERSPSFGDGWWTVQDLGAQRVGRLLEPRPGQRLLDACAGVGGKASHLAQLAGDRAIIDAADRSSRRIGLAEAALARLGVTCVRLHVLDLTVDLPGSDYDGVLLDAPCSGLGVLRRHPEAKWRLQPGVVDELAGLQAQLLDRTATAVRPGGALVYAVCTFTAEEGPGQVDAFLGRHTGFAVEETVETWPHRDGADGFFAARLRHRSS